MEISEYVMRGGCHPDPRTESIEHQIAKSAQRTFLGASRYTQKSLRWMYNFYHFSVHYMTQNKDIINYIYDVRPYPSYLEVETTTCCNFKCKMCEHTYWDEKPQHMKFDQFKYILDQFPQLKWIGVTGIGQSYLNPDYPRILDYCKSKGLYIEQYDNSYYLNDDQARHLVEIGLDKLLVSFDAASEETYKIMRPGSDWNTVLANVINLDKWKKRYHSYWPELCFHFVVCKDNIHEVVKHVELLHSLNIDITHVTFSRMLHNFHKENLFVDLPPQLRQQVMRCSQELGINVQWNADVPECKPHLSTCTAWLMPFIFVDGTVISCCALNEQNDRAWQRKTSLGNIFEQDFRKIYYGEKYTALLEGLKAGGCPEVCTRCPIYQKSEEM